MTSSILISAGLLLGLCLLLAADGWSLAELRRRGRLAFDPILALACQHLGQTRALAARAGVVFSLLAVARSMLGPIGDWLILAVCLLATVLVWRRLRRLAR